jgi:simple sugar transport system ATP-binding protein
LTVFNDRGHPAVKDVSFFLRAGEILGVAGIDGNGQLELCEALYGVRPVASGSLSLLGQDLKRLSTTQRQRLGMRYVPPDRRSTGLVLDMDLSENLVLEDFHGPCYSRRGFTKHRAILEHAEELLMQYDIHAPRAGVLARQLSGGNQQKVVLARALSAAPHLLIAAQPCRGLDVGATEYIYRLLLDARSKGTAVFLVSTELDEILSLSDRIAVIFRGEIMDIISGRQADRLAIGALMTGVKYNGQADCGR